MSAPMGMGALHAGLQRLLAIPWSQRPQPLRLDDRSYLNKRLLGLVVLARLVVASAGLLLAAIGARGAQPVPLAAIAAMVTAIAALSWLALARASSRGVVGQGDLLLQILCDVGLVTLAFALAGSYESAFDYVFIMPLVFAACALSAWRIAIVTVLVATGWGLTEALSHTRAGYGLAFEFASHMIVSGLVVYFAHAVARVSRLHEQVISGRRERVISALGAEANGMLATRAAHMLSTPLGTMAVVVADLRQGRVPPAEQESALETIASQIAVCKLHLSGLLESAGVERGESGYRADAVQLLTEMREECLLYYPSGDVSLDWPRGSGASPEVVIEFSLFNALAGLVKDFARAPPHAAHVKASWDERYLAVEVGVPRASAATPLTARRRERVAVLAAIVGRHGGRVDLQHDGAAVAIRLPHVSSRENNK